MKPVMIFPVGSETLKFCILRTLTLPSQMLASQNNWLLSNYTLPILQS